MPTIRSNETIRVKAGQGPEVGEYLRVEPRRLNGPVFRGKQAAVCRIATH